MTRRFGSALVALLAVGAAACSTAPPPPAVSAATGFSEIQITPNRYRISYVAPATLSRQEIVDRTLRHAAELTLQKGMVWFEIKDQANGEHKRTLEILMGRGDVLAGAAKIYNAKETLAGLKASKISSSAVPTSFGGRLG